MLPLSSLIASYWDIQWKKQRLRWVGKVSLFTLLNLHSKSLADSVSDLKRGDSWKPLILDCSTWTYTDSMGVEVVREVIRLPLIYSIKLHNSQLHIEMSTMKILLLFANLRSQFIIYRVKFSKLLSQVLFEFNTHPVASIMFYPIINSIRPSKMLSRCVFIHFNLYEHNSFR